MNNIVIKNIEPQNIKISGAGEVIGITAVYVNGVNVTEGTVAYVIVPTKTSELVNNSGYITSETDPTVPYYVKNISISDISKWNNKQDELVSGVNIKTINSNSLLGSGNIDINTSYSAGTGIEITEENVINNTITSYDDLDNLPTIPTKISDLTNDSDFVESSELAEVAFNGSYLALSNTPDIPDSTSELINDSGFIDMDLLWSLFPKSTGSGSSINLTDTVKNTPMYLTLGATALSQDGTPTPSSPQDIHTISGSNKVVVEGKNLMAIATQLNGYVDAETLKFEDGTTVGYAATNSVGYYFKTSQLPNTITISDVGGNRMNVCYFNEIPTYQTQCLLRSASNANPRTITIDKTYNYVHIQMSYNNVNVSNIMVNYGNTALSYEPYVSQEADIDLDTIEYCKIGNYEDKFIRTSGKNLFDKNNANILNDYALTPDGFYLEENDQTLWIPCESNTTYTISKIASDRLRVATTRSIPTSYPSIYQYISSNDTTHITITTDSEAKYLCVFYRRYSDTLTSQQILDTLQIEKGSTATEYEPYGSNQWYIKKNIGKVVLDGSENWIRESYSGQYYYRLGTTIPNQTNGLSNYYTVIPYSASLLQYTNALRINNSLIDIVNDKSDVSVADFQTWLSTHNTDVYYILATPSYTDITGDLAEQLETIYKDLTSESEQTNISQVNADLPFTISATTLKSLANL